jgi:tetratricopeptide (TPR) repeat protein
MNKQEIDVPIDAQQAANDAALITQVRELAKQGHFDEALHQLEQAKELLPSGRRQAILLGEIARIRTARGELDAALLLHQEALGVYETSGDLDGKANTLWSMAQIEVRQQKWQEAFHHLADSYATFQQIGRLDGVCLVGSDLGLMLCMASEKEQGIAILIRSRDGFKKLGWEKEAQQTQELLDQVEKTPTRS